MINSIEEKLTGMIDLVKL